MSIDTIFPGTIKFLSKALFIFTAIFALLSLTQLIELQSPFWNTLQLISAIPALSIIALLLGCVIGGEGLSIVLPLALVVIVFWTFSLVNKCFSKKELFVLFLLHVGIFSMLFIQFYLLEL